MESTDKSINPYTTPINHPRSDKANKPLDQEGFAFHSELVANEHFESPLICAKLGIPISQNVNPQLIPVVVMSTSNLSKAWLTTITFISISLFIICLSTIHSPWAILPATAPLLIGPILKYSTSKPYHMSFYFSAKYLKRRKLHVIIFAILCILFILGFFIFYKMGQHKIALISTGCLFVTMIIFQLIMKKIQVIQRKANYYFITGIHPTLLEALAPLPESLKHYPEAKPYY